MQTLIYYDQDMDGITAAAVALKKFPDAILKPVVYGDEWNVNEVVDNRVIVVDFAFPNMDELKQFVKIGEFYWIDHHKTSQKQEVWYDKEIKGNRDVSFSACLLAFTTFFNEIKIPQTVELINDYDLWQFKYAHTKPFYEAAKLYVDGSPHMATVMLQDEDNVNSFVKDCVKQGEILLKNQRRQVIKAFNSGVDSYFTGIKCRIVNTINNVSELGEYIYKDMGYPIAIIWSIREKKLVVSLRSNSVDVRGIAEEFGGGGHKFSSGFSLESKNEIFEKLLKILGEQR